MPLTTCLMHFGSAMPPWRETEKTRNFSDINFSTKFRGPPDGASKRLEIGPGGPAQIFIIPAF